MPVTTMLRGFKIPVPTLDAFLYANGVYETFGAPPLKEFDNEISTLLRSKMGEGQGDARVVIPQRRGYSRSAIAYVAYSWVNIYVQRQIRLGDELPEQSPAAFGQLRQQILAHGGEGSKFLGPGGFGEMGLFVVCTESREWTPKELSRRIEIPLQCDQCDQTFDDFYDCQQHRQEVHGSPEGSDPLPQA